MAGVGHVAGPVIDAYLSEEVCFGHSLSHSLHSFLNTSVHILNLMLHSHAEGVVSEPDEFLHDSPVTVEVLTDPLVEVSLAPANDEEVLLDDVC